MIKNTVGAVILLLFGTSGIANAADTEIRVGITGNSLGFGSWFIAQDGGIFAQNGLSAKFVFLAANAVPAALVTGGIEATPLTESVMNAQLAGYAVRDVGLLVMKPVYEVLARRDIMTMQDLKGRTVIASPAQSLPTRILEYLLMGAGLDPKTDVKILEIGAISARQTLMVSGNGDAIIESTTSALQLRDKIPGVVELRHETDMPSQLSDGVGMSVELIGKNPDLVRRILRSVGHAMLKSRANPQWAGDLLAKRMDMPQYSKELADVLVSASPDHLTPTHALYEAEAAFMSRAGGKIVTADQIEAAWDTRISEAVDQELAAANK